MAYQNKEEKGVSFYNGWANEFDKDAVGNRSQMGINKTY